MPIIELGACRKSKQESQLRREFGDHFERIIVITSLRAGAAEKLRLYSKRHRYPRECSVELRASID